jgi:nucleoside-triphosphatase THEP1/GNAT superfamily N-acetyltransferase
MEKILLTGNRGSGKTSICMKIIDNARAAGIGVSGIVCPGIFEGGIKTAILAQDISTGETHPLATRLPIGEKNPQGLNFSFNSDTLEWGKSILGTCTPTELLIVDEIGPLELIHNQGWTTAIQAISSEKYQMCVFVVRPELLTLALHKWPGCETQVVDDYSDAAVISARIIDQITNPFQITIFPPSEYQQQKVADFINSQWLTPYIIAGNEIIYPSQHPGFFAYHQNVVAGLITYRESGETIEILTLNSLIPGKGIGRKLITRVIQEAIQKSKYTIKLVTTNDNLSALRFYQKFGFRISKINRDAISESRKLKPQIPFLGEHHIPINDEICLEFEIERQS